MTAESTTTQPGSCLIDGCYAQVHGRGLCRVHYDADRYALTSGRSPEVQAEERRKRAQELELLIGPCGESAFASELERHEAWLARRDELIRAARESRPGHRPWAWWEFDARRAENERAPYPHDPAIPLRRRRKAIDEAKIEPIVFVAARGELSEDEIDRIAASAADAEARVGTPSECWGSGGVDYPDQRAVKLWERVRAALPEREAAGV